MNKINIIINTADLNQIKPENQKQKNSGTV